MSKKEKRQVSPPTPRRETPLKSQAAPASRYSSSGEFNPDYSHVKKDLKRIGMLAASFFVVLIVLSFFLR